MENNLRKNIFKPSRKVKELGTAAVLYFVANGVGSHFWELLLCN